jgi:hypothetical protein
MIRSKATLAVAACLAGVISGSIAVAQADTSTGATGATGTSASAATITVNGDSTVTLDSDASAATIQSSYLTALEAAVTDARTKAVALSAQVGDSLGAVTNITEQTNDGPDACSGVVFAAGTARGTASVPTVAPSTSKKKSKPKPKPKAKAIASPPAAAVVSPPAATAIPLPIARTADVTPSSCTVEAQVTVTYSMASA